jgi:hypothetical protein
MNISFKACSNIVNKMNDLQLFLLSDACPESLLEEQLSLVESMNMNLCLLEDSYSVDEPVVQKNKAA